MLQIDPNSINSADFEKLLSMLAANYLSTLGVQWAKTTDVKIMRWISTNTPWVTRAVVLTLASLNAAGIHKFWNPTAGTLLISGLTIPAFLHAGKYITVNYAMQHGYWKFFFANREGLNNHGKNVLPPNG